MAPLENADLRRQVIEACRQMNALGINRGTSGNVSVRIEAGFLVTPSGIAYDRMVPEQIVQMDLDGSYRGDWLPSSEWRLHLEIYRTRDEAGSVVHTHSTYATALSTLRGEIPAFHYMVGVTGGTTLRCADYATFGTQRLADATVDALAGRTACLLANHGQICFARDLETALWLAGEVEALCKQYWIARQLGEPAILDDEEMARVLARFRTYGKQAKDLLGLDATAVEAPPRRDH